MYRSTIVNPGVNTTQHGLCETGRLRVLRVTKKRGNVQESFDVITKQIKLKKPAFSFGKKLCLSVDCVNWVFEVASKHS